VDHCLVNSHCCHLDNTCSGFGIVATGSCTDYQHSIHHPTANANGFVVNNYRRRHYPRPTHDALKFLVANIDAEVGYPFAVAGDFPSRQHF
jgi:hypothetical protein